MAAIPPIADPHVLEETIVNAESLTAASCLQSFTANLPFV